MTPTQREQMWRWLGLCLAVLISFVLVRIAVLNVFYDSGDLHDPAWLASIAWHNGWRLRGPPAYPGSYLTEHVSLIFWLTNALSYVIPLGKFEFYAGCIGAFYAVFAAGVCRAWQLAATRFSTLDMPIAVIVALVATFSPVGMVALRLPHQEMAIPAFALWFFIALSQRTYAVAAIWFVLCLSVREDAGLHLSALLLLWAGMMALTGRRGSIDIRPICGFALAALGCAALAFAAKHMEPHGTDNFTRAYMGDPAWAHVGTQFVLERLHYYLIWRGYVLWPLVLSVAWAAISRNPLLPLGYIAGIPWLILNMLAVHPTPGTLSYYYGFPFWLALTWPLVALHEWRQATGRQGARWPYVLLLLASTVGWHMDRPMIYGLNEDLFRQGPFVYTEALDHRANYQEFVAYFEANRALFGTTVLDQAVSGLLIDHTDRSNWLELVGSDSPPDTLIYFANGADWSSHIIPLLRTGYYHCVYEVPGTRIHLAAHDALRERLTDPTLLAWVSASLNIVPAQPGGC
jgi:hypothetical protein